MSSRRKARELALKVLYQNDSMPHDGTEPLSTWKDTFKYLTDIMDIDKEEKKFAKELVEGTLKNIELIDPKISEFSKHWKISRISVVDRNIMRIACYEMLFSEKVPHAVSIDEAIELSKKYSATESKSFINGVLDGICKDLQKKSKIKN
ncbi:MAG: transcription antitermination factor NusB [Candidatus Omnitrophica bacterium]|nr:transcription antitermination factor NusB [Candidatus Omnitrophota bacterium]MBU1048230.1 transcription antitermination factor NusB [Candidatus Omnitrophota bacterium]MBU1630986.1 transcription antitermination factor NusB [Candidatus Omnitrophota bacterium]MBU1766737.1 transcription antitermination factor NusB [Candidatus Omnitrophota bacterium]MBU1889746.1 transcription antitermination factor NusB [Candidatus Omnitrophota bacterium]